MKVYIVKIDYCNSRTGGRNNQLKVFANIEDAETHFKQQINYAKESCWDEFAHINKGIQIVEMWNHPDNYDKQHYRIQLIEKEVE